MTSAARPTFLPAMGGHSLRDTRAGPISLQSAKDLAAHTKLKYRQRGQASKDELDQNELKKKLLAKEQEYLMKMKKEGLQQTLEFDKIKDLDADDSEKEFTSDEDDDDDDDDDDTFELMKELEKIKQERAEEQERQEREAAEAEMREREERAIQGNPLLNDFDMQSTTSEVKLKRRWDDDVIFKNQSRGEDKPKKRFINDMLRSDFHRKFMSKYIK